MRTYYWYFTTYIRKHGAVVLLSVAAAIVFFSLSIPFLVKIIDRKPTHYIGLVGDVTLGTLPLSVQNQLSQGLTKLEKNGQPTAGLAERWTVEDNGQTFRFILKKNLRWQDGQVITPESLPYRFDNVESITTANDIVFKLPDAYVAFPTVVSQPALKIESKRYWFFFRRPMLIGSGAYRLTDYKQNGQRVIEATIESPTERLIYRFYLTESEAILGFKHGEVDVLPDLSAKYDIADWPNVTVTPQLHPERYLAVFFNNENPLFTKNVRQALSYAVPKPDSSIRAIGPINPQSWVYFEGSKSYDYDTNKAMERMLAEPPQQPLQLELTTTTTFQDEAEKIKRAWEEFGQQAVAACQANTDIKNKSVCPNMSITLTLRINNFPDTSNFQVLLIGLESPTDPDQYYLWHSEQNTNFTRYKNTRIDSLLERGRKTQDTTERRAIYQEFQQFFSEDAPAIFLRYLESYEVRRK